MIKSLRKKFIAISTVCVLVVFAGIFFFLLVFTQIQTNRSVDLIADTIAINRFCTTLSSEITKELEQLNNEKINVPLGSISGVELFANWGPDIPFSMEPKGAAEVDYETKMESSGINQMHFQIWINISLEIRIVNPLHEESIPMTRKIMLVDTVFGGDVPEEYFQWETADLPIDRTVKMLLNV